MQDGNADLFWNEFTGRNDQGAVTGRCGNAHMPPNTTTDYDYQNFTVVLSDCEDWQPGGGQQKEVSALTWQNLIYDWPDDNFIPQKTESQYYIYWMQNMPGFDNQIPYVEEQMANWWYFTADWDSAITNNFGLYNVFQINPGLNDAWYFPDTDGQGFFITVFPDIGYVSLSWFTYDTERPDNGVTANLGEPGHRWLMALGQYHGNRAEMDISITSGGVFDTPTEVTEVTDGTIILTFADCTSGTVEYDIPSIGRKGTVPIQRVVGDNIAFCESYAEQSSTLQTGAKNRTDNNHTYSYDTPVTTADAAPLGNMNVGLNDAWYYPVTNGQGFFINVFPDIGYVSLSWFTYETERPPEDVTANLGEPGHRWLMALGTYSGNQALMDISITSGGIFDTPTEVAEVNDGTIILTFTDCENGMVEYDIPSIDRKGVVPIQRVVGDNVALCEALNTD